MPTPIDALAGVVNANQALPRLVTAGQPGPHHFRALKEAGVRLVIDLRHPSEPRGFDGAALLSEHGMEYVVVPVHDGNLTDGTLEQVTAAVRAGEGRETVIHYRDRFVELVSKAIDYLLPLLKQANVPEKGQELVMKFFKNLGGAPVVIAVTIIKQPDPAMQMANIQSGAALFQNLLLAAHAEGLGTCWMTGANYLEKEILKFLGKEDQQLLAITPIGYSAKEPPAPPRKDREVRWLGFE